MAYFVVHVYKEAMHHCLSFVRSCTLYLVLEYMLHKQFDHIAIYTRPTVLFRHLCIPIQSVQHTSHMGIGTRGLAP